MTNQALSPCKDAALYELLNHYVVTERALLNCLLAPFALDLRHQEAC